MFSWLFGNSKNAEKTVDAVVATGDALFFTDEEKAENRNKINEWYLRYLEATQPQNLARRIIALIVTGLWALLIVAGVIVESLGASDQSQYIFQTLDDVVNTLFITIISFYFLKRIVDSSKRK